MTGEGICVIAGRGAYPGEFVAAARRAGVRQLAAVAFRGETDRRLAGAVDACRWIRVGQLDALLEAVRAFGLREVVMVGQITPGNLFRVRPDRRMLRLLGSLPVKNAHTIFGAVCREVEATGAAFRPASAFMAECMPAAGVLTRRAPDAAEADDLAYGLQIARAVSGLDIGQTVVVKDGVVLAVEGFEGTDRAIRRGGRLGRGGARVVKVAKPGHDARFDIPVVGRGTLKTLVRAGITAMGVEAGRTIFLERDAVVADADARGLALVALATGEAAFAGLADERNKENRA